MISIIKCNSTFKLTHRLKERGYKPDQIIKRISSVKFNQRQESLSRRQKNNQTQKLIFVTQFCEDTNRLKRVIKKHWKLIQNNNTLKKIFPNPPIIAFKGNPSIRNKLVRAKLKPIEQLAPTTQDNQPNGNQVKISEDYPYIIFKDTLQNFRNPIKKCIICPRFITQCFAESTTLKQKFPISLPNPKQSFDCQTRNVIYLVICTTDFCRSQYVGYTTRPFVFRAAEHLSNDQSPIMKHCK